MTEKLTHYETLNIHRSSSIKQIKMAFKRQIREHHPDKNFSSQINLLQESNSVSVKEKTDKKQISMRIIEAYQCLIDSQKRKLYDQQLKIQSLKEQLKLARHKDEISLSAKDLVNTKDPEKEFGKSSYDESTSKNLSQNFDQSSKFTQEIDCETDQNIDSTVFVCQQCFGQTHILDKQLKVISKVQLSINCQHCGLYISIVE